jgi:hypothetical protein
VLFGIGSALTRWAWSSEAIARKTLDDMRRETEQSELGQLDDLEKRLETDQDARTDQFVDQLRQLFPRLQSLPPDGVSQPAEMMGIRENASRLYHSCLESLDRSLALWKASRQMSTAKGRKQILNSREELLAEIQRSVYHLGATLDHVYAASLKQHSNQEELSAMRQELEMGLQVAQQVERRMEDLERDLQGLRKRDE